MREGKYDSIRDTCATDRKRGALSASNHRELLPPSAVAHVTRWLIVFGLAMIHQGVIQGVWGESFTAKGNLEIRRFNYEGELQKTANAKFSVQVDGCQWRIEVEEMDGFKRKIASSYDGTSMYAFGGPSFDAPEMVAILHNNVPYMEPEPHIPILWLVYPGECYIRTNRMEMLPPYVTEVDRKPMPLSVTGYHEDNNVREVVFFNYKKTNAVMRVSEFFSHGDLLVPKRFFLQAMHTSGPPSKDGIVLLECEGTADEISAEEQKSYAPTVAGKTTFTDARFTRTARQSYEFFTYSTNRILSTNEVASLPGFVNYISAIEVTEDRALPQVGVKGGSAEIKKPGLRLVVLLGIAISTGLLVIFLKFSKEKK